MGYCAIPLRSTCHMAMVAMYVCNDHTIIYGRVFGIVHIETAWERVVFLESLKQPGAPGVLEVIIFLCEVLMHLHNGWTIA